MDTDPDTPREIQGRPDAALRRAIGRNLFRARMLVDENRSRLAAEFGVSGMAWQKWENGRRYPNLPILLDFCRRYRFTVEFILEGRMECLTPGLQRRLYKRYPDLLKRTVNRAVESDPAKVPRRGKRRPSTENNAGA